ncbi:hypothetical protein CEP51_003521 [Fusarium floridanum]|uniref:Heterokaryon incompatibility domain-containing protein n=1 Tax=Fusarium floridanum TaxID=1325733 RepID=A0A428S697_9HYPO|nr:hypothetical protein CEP51_003521 [Fusarium floridanum]
MDIIPEPRDAVPEIRVPLAEPIELPDPEADLETGIVPLTSLDAPIRNPTEVAAHLQSSLFFGLLARVLGDRFLFEDFITHSPGKPECRFLSLRNLDTLLHDTDLDQHSLDLQHAADTVREMEALGHLKESPAGETGLCILILVRRLGGLSYDTSFTWSSAFLQKRMRDDGWCPQEIDWIMNHYDPIIACFFARLRRIRSVVHTKCTETACVANNVRLDSGYHQRHVSDGCKCSAISVNADAVKSIIAQGRIPLVSVQHHGRGQISLKVTAASSSSSYTAMSHVWSDGLGNPTANALPQCQLELISTSLSKDLTETGKLGNYQTKSVHIDPIPKQGWSSLRGNGNLFWLDTLCIPVTVPGDSPEAVGNVNKLKSMAINQMGEIYAAAKQVLVLDSELQRAQADSEDEISSTELLARLVCCSWMRRCWTLQEGALATRIAFLSSSGLVTPLVPRERENLLSTMTTEKLATMNIMPGPHVYWWAVSLFRSEGKQERDNQDGEAAARRAPVLSYLRHRFQETLDDITCTLPRDRGGEDELGMFCTVWNSLVYRNTTMKEDLPIIFANLLNINVFGILREDSPKRMQALLRSLDYLPIELLFNTGTPADKGADSLYRWVPSAPSKIRMAESPIRALTWTKDGDLKLSYTERGLIRLRIPTTVREEDFMAIVLDGNTRDGTCSTFILPLLDDWADEVVVELLVHLEYPDKDEMNREDGREEILILEQPSGESSRSRGCLLRLLDKNDGNTGEIIKVIGQFDCPLTWTVASANDLTLYPHIEPVRAWKSFDLIIKCDAKRPINRQRPFHGNLTSIGDLFIFAMLSSLTLVWYASIIIRIVIEVRLGWSNLSPLGRASTILFAIEATGYLAYLVPPPLTQAFFIVDRLRDVGRLSQLDMAYVVLSLVGNLWLLFLWVLIVKTFARAFIYKMWLQSFSPGWPEDSGWAWKVYFAVRNSRPVREMRMED